MKTYILDIIPKIQRYSQKLDNLTVLLNKHWVILDEETSRKSVLIFREKDNQLLISNDGKIEKGSWEYLGNKSLLIDRKDGSYLFKHGFIDDYVLALKVDGKEEYALLVNEQWFEKQLKSLDKILSFLNDKYVDQKNLSTLSIPDGNISAYEMDSDSINGFNLRIDDVLMPQVFAKQFHREKSFLLYSIEEINYYIKYFKSKDYPFFAALYLDKLNVKLPQSSILKLESTAQKHFNVKTVNEALELIAKNNQS